MRGRDSADANGLYFIDVRRRVYCCLFVTFLLTQLEGRRIEGHKLNASVRLLRKLPGNDKRVIGGLGETESECAIRGAEYSLVVGSALDFDPA